MVRHGYDLILSRRQISAMIEEDPLELVLRRRSKVPTTAGGWRWNSVEGLPVSPAQQFRLIPFKRRFSQLLVSTELGDVADTPFVLLGRHDADIEKGDFFECPLGKFVVKAFDLSEPEVKTVAEVDYDGGGENG